MKIIFIVTFIILSFQAAAEGQGLTAQERKAMIIASQRYPDLQATNTEQSQAFDRLLSQAITAKSVVFKDPNWPLIIAQKAQESVSKLHQRTTVGRVPIEKYEDAISKMLTSKNIQTQQYAQLEQAAYQAELSGDAATASRIRAQQAQLQALGRIEFKLRQIEADISRIKQSL